MFIIEDMCGNYSGNKYHKMTISMSLLINQQYVYVLVMYFSRIRPTVKSIHRRDQYVPNKLVRHPGSTFQNHLKQFLSCTLSIYG
jgi:hypothetical protein